MENMPENCPLITFSVLTEHEPQMDGPQDPGRGCFLERTLFMLRDGLNLIDALDVPTSRIQNGFRTPPEHIHVAGAKQWEEKAP